MPFSIMPINIPDMPYKGFFNQGYCFFLLTRQDDEGCIEKSFDVNGS